jgi:membrane protease YdiL (CAAX protease family)
MFRGMLWGALEKRTRPMPMAWLGNRWVVLVITAVMFAIWHREWWRFVVLLWGGLAIGIARMRSGSIVASTTAHSVNNTLPALVILLA